MQTGSSTSSTRPGRSAQKSKPTECSSLLRFELITHQYRKRNPGINRGQHVNAPGTRCRAGEGKVGRLQAGKRRGGRRSQATAGGGRRRRGIKTGGRRGRPAEAATERLPLPTTRSARRSLPPQKSRRWSVISPSPASTPAACSSLPPLPRRENKRAAPLPASIVVCRSRFFSSIANGYAAAAALLAADLELLKLQILFFSLTSVEGIMSSRFVWVLAVFSTRGIRVLASDCSVALFFLWGRRWFVFAAATNSELAKVLAY